MPWTGRDPRRRLRPPHVRAGQDRPVTAKGSRFVLDRERQEADRRRIEAQGIREAWDIIAQGLTPQIISYQSIEAFRELARSPNAKVIVTDGKAPMLLTNEVGTDVVPAAATPAAEAPRRIVRPAVTTPAAPAPATRRP